MTRILCKSRALLRPSSCLQIPTPQRPPPDHEKFRVHLMTCIPQSISQIAIASATITTSTCIHHARCVILKATAELLAAFTCRRFLKLHSSSTIIEMSRNVYENSFFSGLVHSPVLPHSRTRPTPLLLVLYPIRIPCVETTVFLSVVVAPIEWYPTGRAILEGGASISQPKNWSEVTGYRVTASQFNVRCRMHHTSTTGLDLYKNECDS